MHRYAMLIGRQGCKAVFHCSPPADQRSALFELWRRNRFLMARRLLDVSRSRAHAPRRACIRRSSGSIVQNQIGQQLRPDRELSVVVNESH